jgi:hypothetical protein
VSNRTQELTYIDSPDTAETKPEGRFLGLVDVLEVPSLGTEIVSRSALPIIYGKVSLLCVVLSYHSFHWEASRYLNDNAG